MAILGRIHEFHSHQRHGIGHGREAEPIPGRGNLQVVVAFGIQGNGVTVKTAAWTYSPQTEKPLIYPGDLSWSYIQNSKPAWIETCRVVWRPTFRVSGDVTCSDWTRSIAGKPAPTANSTAVSRIIRLRSWFDRLTTNGSHGWPFVLGLSKDLTSVSIRTEPVAVPALARLRQAQPER